MEFHTPVLLQEVLKLLQPQPGQIFIDATLGHGGHALAILKTGATVYGIDQDPSNLKIAKERIQQANLAQNFHPIHTNFSQLPPIKAQGILFDLGLSENQLKSQGRGFSFDDSLSLDMRLDPKSSNLTGEFIINTWSFDQLYQIFTKYGQELYAKPIILCLIRQRQQQPIITATRLSQIINDYYTKNKIRTKTNPATKIFLALKIAVNHELDNLKSALDLTLQILVPSGVCCLITFHSTEDRLVKKFIQEKHLLGFIQKNPRILPSLAEIKSNPLSRSATLRSFTIN